MQERDNSRQIRKIEKEIDNLFRSHKLMQLSRSLAIQYLLMIHEEANWKPILSGQHIPPLDRFTDLAITEQNKYSLTQSINWSSEINTALDKKYVKDINEDIFMTAKDFFNMALSYHGAVSAYTMWNRGIAKATLVGNNTVHFKYSEEEARYDVLDAKLSTERVDKFHNESKSYLQVFSKAKNIVENTVRYTNEHNLSYSIRKVNYKEIMPIAYNMTNGFIAPPYNWKFYNLTVVHFKKFWSALYTICMLHLSALFYAAKIFRINSGIIPSTIIVQERSVWINQLSRWTGLSKETIAQIIEYHTYSAKSEKPDIVLTPFIYVTEKHLTLSSALIITNDLGRNLLKYLANNYKDEYDRNSSVFEDCMISEFKTTMEEGYFKIFTKGRIPSNNKMPDIDVCLIDKNRQQAMICEFKWTIPAAEPAEIQNKVEIEKKALSQLSLLKEYFHNQPNKITEVFNIGEPTELKKLFFVGVLENCAGTASTFNKNTPIIEYTIFCKLLKEKKSLEVVFKEIKERNYLPKINIDFKYIDIECVIGKFKIIWGGLKQIM